MPDKETLQKEIKEIEAQQRKLSDRLAELRGQLASLLSGIKVGDIVTYDHGKSRRRGCVVSLKTWSGDSVQYVIEHIKKDGSYGDRTDVYPWMHPEKENA